MWAAVLLLIGGRSNVPSVETDLPLDKAAHFVVYGALGVLTTLGWLKAGRPRRLLFPLVIALSVGAVDELHQRMVPNRNADVKDWIADALGITFASALVARYYKPGSRNVL